MSSEDPDAEVSEDDVLYYTSRFALPMRPLDLEAMITDDEDDGTSDGGGLDDDDEEATGH